MRGRWREVAKVAGRRRLYYCSQAIAEDGVNEIIFET